MTKATDVIAALDGRTLCTAESCTGGMIGAALTAVPGSSNVYKGGIICYRNEVKQNLLGVDKTLLTEVGPVSAPVALAMAQGARNAVKADFAVSVTGLAGPGGDSFGNPVGTVFIGFADADGGVCEQYLFDGDREAVRKLAVNAALEMILKHL